MKKLLIGAAGAAVLFLGATGFAAADDSDPALAFICPVLGGEAGFDGDNSPFTYIADGDAAFYTVIGPDVMVPVHATNDNGSGNPHASFASPGDTDYTAIWLR